MKHTFRLIILGLVLTACGSTTLSTSEMIGVPTPTLDLIANAGATVSPTISGLKPTPSVASVGIIPIVDPRNNLLIGGIHNREWVSAKTIAPLMSGDETYRLYTMTAPLDTVSGSPPQLIGTTCNDGYSVVLNGTNKEGLIAVAGEWNALPRIPVSTPPGTKVNDDAIALILRSQGLRDTVVENSHSFQIDLNGDNIDEVLMTANHISTEGIRPGATAGDYALVALQMQARTETWTTLIDINRYLSDDVSATPTVFTIRGVADLNGDGKLEVLVDSKSYDGASLTIYTLNESKLIPVLNVDCQD